MRKVFTTMKAATQELRLLAVLFLILAPWFCVLKACPALADTCATQQGPCTLPCTASSTVVQVLAANGHRTELIVGNTGTATMYVILGHGLAAQDYTYGIPLPPYGTPGWLLDLQVQPDPNKNLHTWTSTVSIVTTGTDVSSCFYGEQSN